MPKKMPSRKFNRIGLDQVLGQIVAQASGQYPPTGTTTTTIAGQASAPQPQPGVGIVGSSRPGQLRPLDANGDYFVAEGLPPGATPATQAAPVGAGGPPPQQVMLGHQVPGQVHLGPTDAVNGQPAAAPVNAPSSAPAVSPYRNIGEIYAEQPPANASPEQLMQFNRDRLNKIGQFYGLDPQQIAEAQATASGMLGLALSNPEKKVTPVEARGLVNQIFQAEGTRIVKENDQGAYDLTHSGPGGTTTPMFEGSPTGVQGNPLSQYGVYTPEQIAAIQGQIGQYVNEYQDKFSAAAGGWRPSGEMMDAYHRQAQMIPAVAALESQHAMAQELARLKEQNMYYQIMSQMPSGESSSGGAMTAEQMKAFVNDLKNGSSGS